MDPGQLRTHRAVGHSLIEGFLRSHKSVRRAIVAVDAIHHAPLAFGSCAVQRGRGIDRLRAVGVPLLRPGDGRPSGIGGDVLDVAQVNTMNPGQMRESIQPAKVQHNHGLRLGILFVVGKTRLHQQFLADKPGRRVAALADVPRRTQVLDRRRNRRGIAVKRDLKKLLGAVHLGGKVRCRAGADVAGYAIHMRVRGDLVGRVLRVHHVARLAAELRRIHVGRAAITGYRNHQQVQDGGH